MHPVVVRVKALIALTGDFNFKSVYDNFLSVTYNFITALTVFIYIEIGGKNEYIYTIAHI